MNKKEIESMIERAVWVDRKLPSLRLKYPKSALSKLAVLPDVRGCDDVLADIEVYERPTTEDLAIWEKVMFEWLPLLDIRAREIVMKRCGGMGWKRIAFEANKSRITVIRFYRSALNALEKVVSSNGVVQRRLKKRC